MTITLTQAHLGAGTYEVGAWVSRDTDTTGPEYRYIAKVSGKQDLRARYTRTALAMYPSLTSNDIKISNKVGR